MAEQEELKIEFAVERPYDENKPIAELRNTFLGRRFPIDPELVFLVDSEDSSGWVSVHAEDIKVKLEETGDDIGLKYFEKKVEAMGITSIFFPIKMGRFVLANSDHEVKPKDFVKEGFERATNLNS